MKTVKGLLMFVIALMVGACDDMLDNIRPYLDKGETVYVGKVDSLYTLAGHNRIELVARLKSGSTQVKCQVVATDPDGIRDTLYYDVKRKNGEQYLEYMYNELKEGQYDFSIITFDSSGNKSLVVRTEGYSYGSFYLSTLSNRRLSEIKKQDNRVIITWKSIDTALYTLVTYVNNGGEKKTIKVPFNENETIIEDYLSEGSFTWVSVYKPEKNAMDEFTSASNEGVFPVR